MRRLLLLLASLWVPPAGGAAPAAPPAVAPSERAHAAAATAAQTPAYDLRGIHVGDNDITGVDSTTLALALEVPGVDGVLLIIGWDEVEPTLGHYTWNALDPWIARADSLGKTVTLSVRAGINTPAWLFAPPPSGAGATRLAFSVARKAGRTGICEPDTIAAPWDPIFLAQWDSMLTSLAGHLKHTGEYRAVTILRLTGINRDTDELHLPAEVPGPTDSCVSNAVTTWQAAGYRPSLLLQGWTAITASFQRIFPDKFFSVAIIAATNPFPPLDENDSLITTVNRESLSIAQNLPLLTLASQTFPGHLVIQNNSLYTTEMAEPQTIDAAQSVGTMLAFQTNEDRSTRYGKEAACGGRGDTTQCTSLTFLEMLQTGIYPLTPSDSLRARYLEVFAPNVNEFPQDVLEAHDELVATVPADVPPAGAPGTIACELEPIHPNPSRAATTIAFSLARTAPVRLGVYDGSGRRVASLVDALVDAGRHAVVWSGTDARGARVPSGVYFVRLASGAHVVARRLLRLR